MTEQDVQFMSNLEARYRAATGLKDRSQYKIFYGLVRPAPMLVLGINPAGESAEVMPDGMQSRTPGKRHAASAAFYEHDESDLLDCTWKENAVLNLLVPLAGGEREAVRSQVVKTNIAFRRAKKVDRSLIESWKAEAAPFLAEIVARVVPRLVLLTGVKLEDFTPRFCERAVTVGETLRDPGVKQTVFRAARVALRATGTPALVVQVAHASQFSWTYGKYEVAEKIRALMDQR
jgi:hypothetical protein